MKKQVFVFLILFATQQSAFSDPAPASSATPKAATNSSGQFEVIDVSGQVVGEPELSVEAARSSWNKACQDWKVETKDLNKNNEVLGISCNSSSCTTVDIVKNQCTSTGTYKVKTAGVRVNESNIAPPLPEPPTAAQLPPEHEIATAPPPMVVEAVPAPRLGFYWITGFWGWEGRRHVWIPGRWINDRPGYMWSHEHWDHRGHGWHFESGRWVIRH
jgi:hypothetical protein